MTSTTLRQRAHLASLSVSRSLLAVCRTSWPDLELSAAERVEFVAAARLHRVAPLACVATRGIVPEIADELRADRERAMSMTLRSTLTLDRLTRTLEGLRWLAFKGLVLSTNAHPVPGIRTFSDLDVLIDPGDLRAAFDLLQADGWRHLDYEDMLSSTQPAGEVHWMGPHGIKLDLHWSMINSPVRRDQFDVRTRALLDRRVTARFGLTKAYTLDPEDTLLHTCLHAALEGAGRLLQLVDADHCARHVRDWSVLAERARAWRVAPQVWMVLQRANAAFATPLPDDLGEMLGIGRPLRSSLRLADRIAPVANVRAPHGFTRFSGRAVRPTLRATLAEAGRNAGLGVVNRARPDAAAGRVRIPASNSVNDDFLAAVEAIGRTAGPS